MPLLVLNRDPATESTQSWSLLFGLETPEAPWLQIILTMAVEPSSSESMKRRVGRRWVIQIRFWCHNSRDSGWWATCCGCSDCDNSSLAGYTSSFVEMSCWFQVRGEVGTNSVLCAFPRASLNLPSGSCIEKKKKSKFGINLHMCSAHRLAGDCF